MNKWNADDPFARTFRGRYGPWALVGGGSEGIGEAFGATLAEMGMNLVLVSHEAQPLENVSRSLEGRFSVQVRPVLLDLASEDVVDELEAAVRDLDVGLVIYNAALSLIGRFLEIPLKQHLRSLALNCRGPMAVAHHFGRKLKERGGGGLVLMSSLAGMQGSPMVAGYASTKAFNRVLAEGLWYELKDEGVDVLAVIPGAVRTPGYLSSKPRKTSLFAPPEMEPVAVAREALSALGRRPSLVCGFSNRLIAGITGRVLPGSWAVRLFGSQTMKMYGD